MMFGTLSTVVGSHGKQQSKRGEQGCDIESGANARESMNKKKGR